MADDRQNGDASDGVYDALRDRIGSTGKEVLVPVAASAAAAAATWVAKKGPDLLKELSAGKAEQAVDRGGRALADRGGRALADRVKDQGGVAGLAGKALEKVSSSGRGGRGWGKGRRLPILRSIDVAAPVDEVYEQWTNFDEFRTFMHRVEGVRKEDDDSVVWSENIWGRRRQWQAEITDQVKNQKIAWEIKSGGQGSGVITFHKLAPRLTRIEVVFDWQPQGIVEKLASGLRFHKRAAKADLYRFKAFVETGGEERGGSPDDDGRSDRDERPRTSGRDRASAREERERHRRERRQVGARRSA